MRNFNEWELRKLQLELQQIDEDFLELNNFFGSEAFISSNGLSSDEGVADMDSEDLNFADFDQSIGLLSSKDAADEKDDEQILMEEFIIF